MKIHSLASILRELVILICRARGDKNMPILPGYQYQCRRAIYNQDRYILSCSMDELSKKALAPMIDSRRMIGPYKPRPFEIPEGVNGETILYDGGYFRLLSAYDLTTDTSTMVLDFTFIGEASVGQTNWYVVKRASYAVEARV
jgi:hypothetical protein